VSHQTASKKAEKRSPLKSASPVDKGKVESAPQPVLRVSLLGPFVVEQADGTRLNLDALLGRQQSSALLKLLLCHPDRRVSRDQISEALWPGQLSHVMEGSLSVAKSLLKTRLEAVCGQPLMPRVSGEPPYYSLADQTVIWTDVDAAEQHIRQAGTITNTQETLSVYEQAFRLLQRGELLADDQAAYWYQANLVQDRRKRLSKLRTHCVFRIVDLALECDDVSRALNTLFLARDMYPTDEEIVFRLMEVLAQQGQTAEALRHYSLFEMALLESNTEPREEIRLLAHRLRVGKLPGEQAEGGRVAGQPTFTRPALDWGEAPHSEQFYGREQELSLLRSWLVENQCRLVTIVGMAGIGKTSLAAAFVHQVQEQFTAIFWRSLQNAPPLASILQDCLKFLSEHQHIDFPDDINQQITLLLTYLQKHHCLLVLDNVETLMQERVKAGNYRDGYQHYKLLFQRLAASKHQSSVLLTSREKLKELAVLEGIDAPVRSLTLSGLTLSDGQALLKDKGLLGSDDSWQRLIQLYAGNPLALKLISQLIREVFNGNIAVFLQEEHTVVGDISNLLHQQMSRLSEAEKDIMYWLAIEREAVPIETLWEDSLVFQSKKELLDALASLRQRSMIEMSDTGAFTLQPVIMEYVIDEFVRQVEEEIQTGRIGLLASHALLKAHAKEYLREAQARLILAPIAERLLRSLGREKSEEHLKALVEQLHQAFRQRPAYAAGNILNLLIHMQYDLAGYDFSDLIIRQAFLAGKILSGINFSHAKFVASVFTDTFGSILSIAFSSDGMLLAAGTTNNIVRIWHAQTGTPRLTLQGHIAWVRAIAFSSVGHLLISGAEDQTIRLWDADSGVCLKIFQGHSAWIRSVAFSSDSRLIASGSEDQTIRLWHVEGGQCLAVLEGHLGRVRSVAFQLGGDLLASGGEDQVIRIWEVKGGRCLTLLRGHTGRIREVSFSPDGKLLASGSDDSTIKLWDVDAGTCLRTLYGHTDCVRSIVFNGKGDTLASGGEDQTVRLWNVTSGTCLKVLQGHAKWVWSVAFHRDGNILASGSEDQTIRLWETESGRCFSILQGYVNWVWSLAFSPDGHRFVSGGEDQMVCLWDMSSGRCLNVFHGHRSRVRSVVFHPVHALVASSSEDKTIRLWDVQSGFCIATFPTDPYRLWSLAFSPDGTWLAGSGEDYAVSTWEIPSGLQRGVLQGHTDRIRVVACSIDNVIASGSEDQTVRLWDSVTSSCLHVLHGHVGRVWAVAFSPDGTLLASGGDDGTVRVWHVSSGQQLHLLRGHTARIRSLAFHADGTTLASGSEDATIRLWNVRTGSCLALLQGHTGRLRCVAFHPRTAQLASSSDDGTIRIWDSKHFSCMNTLKTQQPYEDMIITGVQGLTEAQKRILKELGAREEPQM
jgi:WD40 repeat protein/DNA-binding SARP family transcriptional activator